MPSITYVDPSGRSTLPVDVQALRVAVLDLPDAYWRVGSGGGALGYTSGGTKVEMLLLPNLELRRLYLHLRLKSADDEEIWLSMFDRQRLSEIVNCNSDWLASSGLFLPLPLAWTAIEHFIATGERSPQVEWETPEGMPDDSNW